MKKSIFILLSVCLLLVFACCKKNNPYYPVSQEIFPLKVGNHWEFRTVTADTLTTYHANDVAKDTLYSGETWYVLTYDNTIRTTCRNNSAGWWFLYQATPSSQMVPSLYYRYPAGLNEQYMTLDSTLVTVASIDDIVTVPAGKFTCYRYHMVHYKENYVCEEYLAPGFGLIWHVIYAPPIGNPKIGEVTELVSYSLR